MLVVEETNTNDLIKTLGDEGNKNRVMNMVSDTIKNMEAMSANEDTIIDTYKIRCTCIPKDNLEGYKIIVHKQAIYIEGPNTEKWGSPVHRHFISEENGRELFSKAVIINLIIRAAKKLEIADINELVMENALDSDNYNEDERRIEVLASKLLVPTNFFSHELGESIIRLLYNNEKYSSSSSLIDIHLERSLLIERLKQFGINEKMAKIRLATAEFMGDFHGEDPRYLSNFTEYYNDYYDDNKEIANELK